ncbi:cation:proton antiporter [Sulfurovum sp. zt1-1]|uniref:Cation:proton antiporter n=1 Tax=Sulfurovum zhangzhouensis TaxID=3019067 RepID=A0ABT7QV19_9BACT|nr:cation:proton antiporter [Sulfurovum zhangzhouensis]MDM5270671.1 cation:proton antiporter [Sulfurovum zhangzhouensis]
MIEVHEFFLTLFLILVSARLLGEVFSRFGIPAVLGELSAGVLLGSSFLELIEVNEILKILAEIGIILLLFEVGLNTDFQRLKEAGKQATIVAFFGVISPFITAFLVSYYFFHLSPEVSLFIGGTLTATSIGITLRVLKDLKQENSSMAQVVIGAAVLDDIIGVILLVFIYDYALHQEVSLKHTMSVTAFIITFLVFAPFLAHYFSLLLRKLDKFSRVPGFIPTSIISLIVFFAYLAHLAGAPEILGAFSAGIALSRRFIIPFGASLQKDEDFLEKITHSINPIMHMFTPIFFVTVGLSMNLKIIDFTSSSFWIMSFMLFIVAVLGKYLGAFLVNGYSFYYKSMIGVSMIPRGEVGLIFAEIGRINGIIGNEIYAVLIFVIVLTTIVPPFILKWLCKREYNDG